ncbi:MAG TPA: Uma2 family endonuclease [Isosphaeraceae bacterium]|nr:Uma2 family endonuclease [Isosphaeraceae bacterium]
MPHVIYDNLTLKQFLRLPETKPPLEYIDGKVVQKWDDPVIYDGLTLMQFLRLPEAKPALEYIDGKVVQKVSPKTTHSVLQTMLAARILEHCRPTRIGQPYIELRCTFGKRSLVPDIAFFARGRIPKDQHGKRVDDVYLSPDLALEIISPDQTIKNLSARMTWCVQNGVRLAWLIQPTKCRVYIFHPDRDRTILEPGESLSGEDVLPGFAQPLDEMFGWLIED